VQKIRSEKGGTSRSEKEKRSKNGIRGEVELLFKLELLH
jgi:hypothetical protein